jgi:hypothetical protein
MIEDLLGSYTGIVAVAALILAVLAFAGLILVLVRQQRLLNRYRRLMTNTSGGNLEAVLNDHVAQVRSATVRVEAVDQLAHHLERASYFNLQHMAMVRFNPFHDSGGDQSFAIAMADGHGDGVVLSSLHAREATRVYAKPLRSWESGYSLSDEEKQAIDLAKQSRTTDACTGVAGTGGRD